MFRNNTILTELFDAVLFALERVRVGAMAIVLILVVKIVGLHLFPSPAPMAAPTAVASIR
jgi:hypothetical protein